MEISKITCPDEWKYFSKGNANILFQYTGKHDYLTHNLLRIRLRKGEENYVSTCELYDFIELKCKPLFPKEIFEVQLVILTNEFLGALDTHGNAIMLEERYGLMLPNILDGVFTSCKLSKNCLLFVEEDFNSIIFELKPKWLYDNEKDNYCRTCSLNQYRQYPRHFCPLDFLYEDTMDRGLQDLLSPIPMELYTEIKEHIPIDKLLKEFLSDKDNVYMKLKRYQSLAGIQISDLKDENDVTDELSLTMTLRDVGLFLKFEKLENFEKNLTGRGINNIESKKNITLVQLGDQKFITRCLLVDLDLKSNMKYIHWKEVDRQLGPISNSINPNWRFCAKKGKTTSE